MGIITKITYVCDCCGISQQDEPVQDWMKRDTKRARREMKRRHERDFRRFIPFNSNLFKDYFPLDEFETVLFLCPTCRQKIENLESLARNKFWRGYKRLKRQQGK